MPNGVPVVSPFKDEQCECGEENIERFNGHGAELEQHCRLESHEERGEKRKEGLPCPGDNRKEHE